MFDNEQMNWVPRTVDVRKMAAPVNNLKGKRDDTMPSELMMSDANIISMRVPNFSYAGDLHNLRHH
jgi:hypothetical protein